MLPGAGQQGALALSELNVGYRRPIVAEDRAGWLASVGQGGLAGLQAERAFAKGPEPGDRAPDVALSPTPVEIQSDRTTWLSDAVLDTRHILLLFEGLRSDSSLAGRLAEIRAMVQSHAGRVRLFLVIPPGGALPDSTWTQAEVLPDPNGTLHHCYGAQTACLYLIRPDGYVGYRSLPPDAKKLGVYLDRIFTA
jgi:hypothetical protein